MTKEEKEKVYELNKLKDNIILNDSVLKNYQKQLENLEIEKKYEAKNRLKMIKFFGISTLLCLIATAIIKESFLVLPALLPAGIGIPTVSLFFVVDKIIFHSSKKRTEKFIENLEEENTLHLEQAHNILKSIEKKEIKKKEIKEEQSSEKAKIDSLISELIEAKKTGNLKETLKYKYKISDSTVIDLCNSIVEEELNLQKDINYAQYTFSKEYKKTN